MHAHKQLSLLTNVQRVLPTLDYCFNRIQFLIRFSDTVSVALCFKFVMFSFRLRLAFTLLYKNIICVDLWTAIGFFYVACITEKEGQFLKQKCFSGFGRPHCTVHEKCDHKNSDFHRPTHLQIVDTLVAVACVLFQPTATTMQF